MEAVQPMAPKKGCTTTYQPLNSHKLRSSRTEVRLRGAASSGSTKGVLSVTDDDDNRRGERVKAKRDIPHRRDLIGNTVSRRIGERSNSHGRKAEIHGAQGERRRSGGARAYQRSVDIAAEVEDESAGELNAERQRSD